MQTIAIITPVYATENNRRLELLMHTMDSVARQNAPGIRYVHLIIDNGSTADVPGAIKDFNDPRVRYLYRERRPGDQKSPSIGINYGIEHCLQRSADVFSSSEAANLAAVTYLHSDDLLTEDSLIERMRLLKEGMVYSEMANFTGRTVSNITHIGKKDIDDVLALGVDPKFTYHSFVWSLGFLGEAHNFSLRNYGQKGIFDTDLRYAEDLDAMITSLRAAKQSGATFDYSPLVSVLYRVHESSITGGMAFSVICKDLERISTKHFGTKYSPAKILFNRFTSDLPWSVFTFLPDELKRPLRPLRDMIKRTTEGTDMELFNAQKARLELILRRYN